MVETSERLCTEIDIVSQTFDQANWLFLGLHLFMLHRDNKSWSLNVALMHFHKDQEKATKPFEWIIFIGKSEYT